MATVTGFTAERMLVIENETVVDGEVVGDNLHLLRRDGVPIDAGNVRGATGAQGPKGDPGTNGTNGIDGTNGLGVPAGGAIGQFLAKNSAADNDTLWKDVAQPPAVIFGRLLFFSGSKNAGSYTSADLALPTPAVASMMVGWLDGHQGYGGGTTTSNGSLIRRDNGQHLWDTGAFQAAGATTVALRAFSAYIPRIEAGQSIKLYHTVNISGSNNYYTVQLAFMMFPL